MSQEGRNLRDGQVAFRRWASLFIPGLKQHRVIDSTAVRAQGAGT